MTDERRHVLSDEAFALTNVTSNRFYLSGGKAVCENGLSGALWYEMDSPDSFQFDESLESAYLNSEDSLPVKDKTELKKLRTLNQILNEFNVFAVSFPQSHPGNVVVVHEDNPDTCFLAEIKDITAGKITQVISDSMMYYSESRTLSSPMIILDYHDDGVFAY